MIDVNPTRIGDSLAAAGFLHHFASEPTHDVKYVRRKCDAIFEGISISHGRRSGQPNLLVSARAICSIVPGWTALRGLAVSEHIHLPTDSDTGWSNIGNVDDVVCWENLICERGPAAAAEYTSRIGAALLEDTKIARAACSAYFRLAWATDDIDENIVIVKGKATQAQLTETRRLLTRPIIMIPDGLRFYELAVLAVLTFSEEVDKFWRVSYGLNPDISRDRSMMVRLQLLASRFACEPGWTESTRIIENVQKPIDSAGPRTDEVI